jgi:hypothetical protein
VGGKGDVNHTAIEVLEDIECLRDLLRVPRVEAERCRYLVVVAIPAFSGYFDPGIASVAALNCPDFLHSNLHFPSRNEEEDPHALRDIEELAGDIVGSEFD